MFFVIFPDKTEHIPAPGGVEAGHGLVQHHDLRIHGKNARQGNSALLSAGEVKGGLVQGVVGQTDDAAVFPDAAVDLVLVQAHVLGAEGHIGIDRLFKELILGILEHQAHGEPGRPGELLTLINILAVDEHPAGGGVQKAVEMLDEGGFPAPRVADKADELPPAGGEAHMIHCCFFKGGPGTVNMGQILDLQDFVVHWALSPRYLMISPAHSSTERASRESLSPAGSRA